MAGATAAGQDDANAAVDDQRARALRRPQVVPGVAEGAARDVDDARVVHAHRLRHRRHRRPDQRLRPRARTAATQSRHPGLSRPPSSKVPCLQKFLPSYTKSLL